MNTNQIDTDQLEEALEALQTALECIQNSGLADNARFRAYNLCQLEGQQGGWMGGPFLIDEVRAALEAAGEEDED